MNDCFWLDSYKYLLSLNFLCCNRYREHIVWTDKELNLKLSRKGILTHIYAPMVSSVGIKSTYILIIHTRNYMLCVNDWLVDILKLSVSFLYRSLFKV